MPQAFCGRMEDEIWGALVEDDLEREQERMNGPCSCHGFDIAMRAGISIDFAGSISGVVCVVSPSPRHFCPQGSLRAAFLPARLLACFFLVGKDERRDLQSRWITL